jgi:hypothetical protein
VKTKKTSLQLFTVYAVPPDDVQDIAIYTIPFALGKKQSDHQPQLIKILWQTKGLEKVTSRFCKDTNSCEPTWFEQVVIQNDQLERVYNLSILQGSTYGKQVGHSIEFNEKTPSCKRCFLSWFERLFPSDNKISASQINQCQKCSDWLIDYNNSTGWILKPSFYPTVSCTSFEESAPSPPQG